MTEEQTMPSNKAELRALVEQMTQTYLANGGQITLCKAGRRTIGNQQEEE